MKIYKKGDRIWWEEGGVINTLVVDHIEGKPPCFRYVDNSGSLRGNDVGCYKEIFPTVNDLIDSQIEHWEKVRRYNDNK